MKISRFIIPVFVLAIFIAVQCGQEQVAEQTAPAQSVQAPASPVVNADRTVTFAVLAPESKNVILRWIRNIPQTIQNQPMNRDENGIWSLTVGPLEPEIYEYLFVVDGTPMNDPGNISLAEGLLLGNNMVEVPADPPAFYEFRDVPHGVVAVHTFTSPVLDIPRKFRVYTPPGYNTNQERYPVLYLFHGAAGDDRTWVSSCRANYTLDNLIADGKAVPMIIVMPNGQYRGEGIPADGYEQDLLNVIIPTVEREYRVKADAQNRAMAGLSMGGGHTLDIGVKHPELFTWLGIFSIGIRETYEGTHGQFLDEANTNLNLFWMGVGEDDGVLPRYQALAALLDQKSVKYSSVIYPGAHNNDVWRKCLRDFAPLLFR